MHQAGCFGAREWAPPNNRSTMGTNRISRKTTLTVSTDSSGQTILNVVATPPGMFVLWGIVTGTTCISAIASARWFPWFPLGDTCRGLDAEFFLVNRAMPPWIFHRL